MISMDKKYRTRDGREVRIYAVDGGGVHLVHGAVKNPEGWAMCSWMQRGSEMPLEGSCDLIEVKPRIKRTVWVNVYEDHTYGPYSTKCNADRLANDGRFACVKVEIDCEKGEGL
jgi:hypothetical protein